ncbi:MAG: Rrf2 family transcriptional regulator [Clostridiales bacterium]|nr:Rrf2 family transcriptional regulator [Clostridiales bacterium]
MQISSRFTIAIHILTCAEVFKDTERVTSDFLAASIGTNAVIVRKILIQLKNAGIVRVARGNGGTVLSKPAEEIKLLDVYRAVDCTGSGGLFRFHEKPNPNCPVGRNIHRALDDKLLRIENAMENEMCDITLADVIRDAKDPQ